MRKSFLMIALAGLLIGSASAAVDLTFEADDTNLLQYPTFSGTTGNITGGVAASTEQTTAEQANDILNAADGVEGTQSYKTSLAFNFDNWSWADPIPPDRSQVRITDYADRHLLSAPAASGGVGLYLLYDGAAGDIEVSISIREEPVSSANNEVYETMDFQVLSGSTGWQYMYFPFSTITTGPDNWGLAIALGDGIYDGGDVGDTPALEAVMLRPIPGTTQANVPFTLYIDDIHSGAEHTPDYPVPPPPPAPNYANAAIEQVFSVAELGTIAGGTVTDIQGVVYDDTTGTLFAITNDASFVDQILALDPDAGTGTALNADLQAGDADGDTRFTGGLVLLGGDIYYADYTNSSAATTEVVAIDSTTGAWSSVVISAALEGLEGLAALDATTMVTVRGAGNGGDETVGTVTTAGVIASSLATITGGNPSAATVDDSGNVIVAASALEQIVSIAGLTGTPVQTNITPAAWTGDLEIHNLEFAPDGALIATDRGDVDAVRILDNAAATHDILFDDIATAVGGAAGDFSSRDDRGLALGETGVGTQAIYLANFNDTSGIGIVRISFSATTPVSGYELYR